LDASRKHPVVIIKEEDLPVYLFLVGNKKKMKTYLADIHPKNGFFVSKCNGKK